MMNAAALQEDPKEVFKTYSQVLNALCVSYHARYPLQPLETLTMVLLDIGRYMAGIIAEHSGTDTALLRNTFFHRTDA